MKKWGHTLLLCACLTGWIFCSGWGFLVHRTVNQLAVYQLPQPMRTFFYQNMDYVVRHSVRPDLRRNTDASEAPKHFINAETFGDSSLWKMPADYSDALKRYNRDTMEKAGYLPYWIIEMKEKLTQAFRQKNRDSILFYAADLAHYIGDAHVPLHTTSNYDGQLTGQKGLHSLWESTIPELELNQYQLYNSHKARYLKNPSVAIWATLRKAHGLLPEMFQQEKEATRQFADTEKYRVQNRNGREVKLYTTAFAREYSQRLGATINQQLLLSANLCADFWYTSWVDAGCPDLKDLLILSKSTPMKKQMQNEWKAYRKNQLLNKEWLLSRQKVDKEE